MQFYAVFKTFDDPSVLVHYGRLEFAPAVNGGGALWLVHKCGEHRYAHVITTGSALRSMARDTCRKVDGFIVPFECDHWPAFSDAFEALRLHLGLTVEQCDMPPIKPTLH